MGLLAPRYIQYEVAMGYGSIGPMPGQARLPMSWWHPDRAGMVFDFRVMRQRAAADTITLWRACMRDRKLLHSDTSPL